MHMKNKRKKNTMKLSRHKTLVWIQGWINGRTGTAGISDGSVKSGFLLHLSSRYAAYTAAELAALDTTVHSLTVKAEKLLLELEYHRLQDTKDEKPGKTEGSALADIQAERAASAKLAAERREREAKRKKAMGTLVEISHQIKEAEEGYYTQILETAKNLEAVFTAYAKGVLWRRPLTASLVPPVDAETTAVAMYREWRLSEHILKKIEEVTADEKEENQLAEKQMGNETGSKAGEEAQPAGTPVHP